MRHTLWLLALSSTAALTAQGQKDLAGCKTVYDASLKTTATPHHAYSTIKRAGKSSVSEVITVNDKSYVQYEGKWRASPLRVADMLKQEKENLDSAKVYVCKPTGAGAYHVRTENADSKAEADVWVANGVITRMEEDVDTGDGDKMHVSTKYDYSNVKVPPGV
ncbi:MAG TPA: hypothetical protein VFA43_23610 [Gemmatimonadaceae bacterium]|nr:hypothetical protein [Gemmatimonadaceae bacterium]